MTDKRRVALTTLYHKYLDYAFAATHRGDKEMENHYRSAAIGVLAALDALEGVEK